MTKTATKPKFQNDDVKISKPLRGRQNVDDGKATRKPAKSRATREAIVHALESDILSGRLAPGCSIDERSLSLRFDVSRTPVREAVARLRSQGLVEVRPRAGSFVARISLTEVLQL